MSDPANSGPRGFDFGLWLDDDGNGFRAVWEQDTGTLVAVSEHGRERRDVLTQLPASGHPTPRRSDLIAQAALAGWEARSGRRGSQSWLQARIETVSDAELAAIDWTVACLTAGCSAKGQPIHPATHEWGDVCPHCLTARHVAGYGLAPSQLEAELRSGSWELAVADPARRRRGR